MEQAVDAKEVVPEAKNGQALRTEFGSIMFANTNEALTREVVEALKTVRDPEIPVNLIDLGLIYRCLVRDDGLVHIDMTLTAPTCPVAGSLPGQVQAVVSLVPGVSVVLVDLVWDPPWTRDRMTDEALLELGLL